MKRATAIILAVCALFSVITYTAKADDHPFLDVPEDHLCKQAIYELYNLRIITGNKGRFNPDKAITYAEAITILEKTFGKAERLPAWKWWAQNRMNIKDDKRLDRQIASEYKLSQ